MNCGGFFDPSSKQIRINELEKLVLEPNFWSDKRKSEKIINELNTLKSAVDDIGSLKNKIKSNVEIIDMLKDNNDEDMKKMIEEDIDIIKEELERLEVLLLLSGEFDTNNAVMEIHSGAGGTEACDWANMLYRMYMHYFDKKGYKYEVIEEQPGEEAGIKSVTMLVRGNYAFGYLKNEKGVHRLVRLSPFDSNARRHTSFASVDITPLFENNEINIEINDVDLKIDVYRSGGAGGQHVNTTDSAVRITHLPTKTVVTCQNERSQISNREKAMEVLKNKLYQLELEKRQAALKDIKGSAMDNAFGSQIRSYVMHPYSLVKDHRTDLENTNVLKVLDGDLDSFINSNLKRGN